MSHGNQGLAGEAAPIVRDVPQRARAGRQEVRATRGRDDRRGVPQLSLAARRNVEVVAALRDVAANLLRVSRPKLLEAKTKHPEVGNCNTCHDVHGSGTAGILREPQSTLCVTCHDVSKTHAHPFQGPAKDPRTGETLQCTSCHKPHSSPEEHLLIAPKKRSLCVQCHLGPNMEVRGRGGR